MKRRTNSLLIVALAGMLGFTSCKNENKDEAAEPMQHEMHQEDAMNGEMKEGEMKAETAEVKFKDEQGKEVFNAYLELKNALVQTDADGAKSAAQKLEKALGEKEAASVAKELAATSDVNVQRELFSELNKAMEPVLKESISEGKIYKQFCPMAFEGKGDYWYSDSDQIRNPYFGDKMLKCGRVDDTIM